MVGYAQTGSPPNLGVVDRLLPRPQGHRVRELQRRKAPADTVGAVP